jgi:hypothetical protein
VLDLIVEAIVCVRRIDPADTAAGLLAAWHGFGTVDAAGALLAQDNPDDAVLARNARPVLAAEVTRLREVPSLPDTDIVTETVEGLVPDDFRRPAGDQVIVDHDPGQTVGQSAAGIVRRSILTLAQELTTLPAGRRERPRPARPGRVRPRHPVGLPARPLLGRPVRLVRHQLATCSSLAEPNSARARTPRTRRSEKEQQEGLIRPHPSAAEPPTRFRDSF